MVVCVFASRWHGLTKARRTPGVYSKYSWQRLLFILMCVGLLCVYITFNVITMFIIIVIINVSSSRSRSINSSSSSSSGSGGGGGVAAVVIVVVVVVFVVFVCIILFDMPLARRHADIHAKYVLRAICVYVYGGRLLCESPGKVNAYFWSGSDFPARGLPPAVRQPPGIEPRASKFRDQVLGH